MSETPETLALATRNHLLVTAELVARGTVWPLGGRLGDRLRQAGSRRLGVRDVELRVLPEGEAERVDEARIAVDSVILAHEYVAMGGDPHLQRVHRDEASCRVRIWAAGLEGLTLEGRMATGSLDEEGGFLVLFPERIRAEGARARAVAACLLDLPYLLVNRAHVTALVPEATPGVGS